MSHPRLAVTIDVILAKDWTNPEKREALIRAVKHWVTVREGMDACVMLGYELGREDRDPSAGGPT